MEKLIEFTEANINLLLLAIIVLGGIFITKYTKDFTKVKDSYKVLFASVIVSIVLYYVEEYDKESLPQFLFTYLFATSFYELIVKEVMKKIRPGENKKSNGV